VGRLTNISVTKSLHRIRYVVTGGGGADLYPCQREWFTSECRSGYHFLYVRVGNSGIKVTAVPRRGDTLHRFWTARRSRPVAPTVVVGKAGFEPATSASRTLRAAKLRHFP
jgi:hypothetical protein